MIDSGQAVDIKGISEKPLIKHLKKLFVSLNLMEKGDRVFLLPSNNCPTLELVGPLIEAHIRSKEQKVDDVHSVPPVAESKQLSDNNNSVMPAPDDDASGPRRR